MNSRTIAILIFIFGALVLAVVGALIFLQNEDQPQQQPPENGEVTDGEGSAPEESGDPTATPSLVEVVVSLQTVPRGFQITQDNVDEILTTDMRDPASVATNVLFTKEDAVGLYARTDIFQGETITRDAFVRDPTVLALEEFGPSALIPEGFIAMSVPVAENNDTQQLINLVALGIDEGDFVDILLTFDLYRIDPQFQTYLENDAYFFFEEFIEAQETVPTTAEEGEDGDGDGEGNGNGDSGIALQLYQVPESFGRFEELPTGDLALVSPSEFQRPIEIGLVLQNAKLIQVGLYTPEESPIVPTPTSDAPEGEGTPEATPPPTPTPPPAQEVVVALAPQQMLLLKHALEVGANVDFALRGAGDNQLFTIENVDLDFLLEFFNIEIPPNFDYTLEVPGGANSGGNGGSNGNGDSQPANPDNAPPEGGVTP